MQCANCGRPLRPDEVLCPLCGEPVAPDVSGALPDGTSRMHQQAFVGGSPVDPYAPTIYGPPVGPERYASAIAPLPAAPVQRRVGGYRPIAPLRPAAPRRTGWLPVIAAATGLVLTAVLVIGALVASGQRIGGVDFGALRPQTSAPVAARPTQPPAPACPAPTVDPAAAQTLTDVQLTTGVSNWDDKQLDPVDDVTTFIVGQQVYVTFKLATNEPGTVVGSFCGVGMSGSQAPTDTQVVPANYRDGRGAFRLQDPLTTANVGPGVVVLTWNGAAAAVLYYTVTAA
jgi:hypothetical protein